MDSWNLLGQASSLVMHRLLAGACLPTASGLDDADITAAAARLRPPGARRPGWVAGLAEAMGGRIRLSESTALDHPLLVADAQERFLISMPAEHALGTRGRDWFIGLSIGHMSLHWPPRAGWKAEVRLLYVPRLSEDHHARLARDEAAKFTVELLLPENRFTRHYVNHGLDGMADHLGVDVSHNLLAVRAASLGLGLQQTE